jgi:flagellum-specific peptidoglycan hydrolase FlgJ
MPGPDRAANGARPRAAAPHAEPARAQGTAAIPGLRADRPAAGRAGAPTRAPQAKPADPAEQAPTPAPPDAAAKRAFIRQIAPGAAAAQRKYGVPAAVTIAQAIEESGWGRSALAVSSHNLFGMKGSGPAGSTAQPTREFEGNQWVTQNGSFRAYNNIAESIDDHGRLLATEGYYRHAMTVRHDPNSFADALTGVYATDPSYGAKLIGIMRQYNLYSYDTSGAAGAPGAKASGTPSPPATPRAPATPRGGGSNARPKQGNTLQPGTPDAHPGSVVPIPGFADPPPKGTGTGQRPAGLHPGTPGGGASRAAAGAGGHGATPAAAPSGGAAIPGVGGGRSSGAMPAAQAAARSWPQPGPQPGRPAPAGGAAARGAASPRWPDAPARAPRGGAGSGSGIVLTSAEAYHAQIPASVRKDFAAYAKRPLEREEGVYRDICGRSGLRWELLAACDWMQCETRAKYSPVHGEKLGTQNPDGTVFSTRSAALEQCADDLIRLAYAVYRIDLTAPGPLSVRDLAYSFAAFRWGGLLKQYHTSPMEFPYSVAGLTVHHTRMRWPNLPEPNLPDKAGGRFHMPFGAVPTVVMLNYPATA